MNHNRPSGISSRTMSDSKRSPQVKAKFRSSDSSKTETSNGLAKVTVRSQQMSYSPKLSVKTKSSDTTQQTYGGKSTMDHEADKLSLEVKTLREKNRRLESVNDQLRQRERDLSDRLSAEAQKHVNRGGKFDNLSQETLRLTQIIERYEALYTQGRLDALDDLDQIKELSKLSRQTEIKPKILLAVVVASFRLARDYTSHVRKNVRQLLAIPDTMDGTTKGSSYVEMTQYVQEYLQSTTNKFDIEPIVKGITEQMKDVLPDYPNLDRMPGLTRYTCECARLSWAMCNQNPPLEIECTAEMFSSVTHTRFHNSNDKGFWVKCHVWPALVDSSNKAVLYRGVVIT